LKELLLKSISQFTNKQTTNKEKQKQKKENKPMLGLT